jgi:simple sugar transport system ATP-binding protein
MNIEIQHIHKRFGRVHANNDISAVFKAGRIIGILGENGAGKSTLMKILSGYQPADSGSILLNGAEAVYHTPLAAIAAGIGMLQQDPLDIAAFSVLENFIYGQSGHMSLRHARATLAQLCADFGFDLDPDAPASQLSIGQRQQLEIARLLALGVKTLILDEPTTGISAYQKQLLFDALRALARQQGMLILLVSHKLEDVQALCDEVVILRGGMLVGGMTMPATTQQLISLMFGQELAPQARPDVMPGTEVFALEGVTARSKRVHVENLSLRMRAGEVIGLAGLDGSGQELLMRVCVGLQRVSRGTLRLAGQDISGLSYRERLQRGIAFGAAGRLEEGLVAGLSLLEHMALVEGERPFIDWAGAKARTDAQIQHYHVRGRAEDRIEALSGGNQQRWLMALLPPQVRLLVLEQPTRGLDVDSARWIWQQILERREQGTAILFSSPDLDELVAYSDRLLVFFAGRHYEVPDARRATVEQLGRLIGGQFEEAQA